MWLVRRMVQKGKEIGIEIDGRWRSCIRVGFWVEEGSLTFDNCNLGLSTHAKENDSILSVSRNIENKQVSDFTCGLYSAVYFPILNRYYYLSNIHIEHQYTTLPSISNQ